MKYIITLIAAMTATPAICDVTKAVDDHIITGYATFAEAAQNLRDTANADCSIAAVQPAWNATFDAWLGVSHLRFGPVEDAGRSVSIAFWPDERGAGPRALATLLADQDDIIVTPEGTAQLSVAARGLFGLEYLLYDPQFASAGAYGCDLIRALSADLAVMADDTKTAWTTGYAALLRTAGDADNQVFLTSREGTQILFTSLLAGLEFSAVQRLGRPMGTFERPRPNRAESWRSERSLHNIDLSLQALRDLTATLTDGGAPLTLAAFDNARAQIAGLADPTLAGVADPQGRFKIEVLQQAVQTIETTALSEIGGTLGVSAGFNSADGD